MGQFTSHCKSCGKACIFWFLQVSGRDCSNCGVYNTEEEIKESWNDNYFKYISGDDKAFDDKEINRDIVP